jgi:hypothetical protein
MLVIAGFVAGAVWGGLVARRRRGSAGDIAQYAVGYGVALAVAALFATLAAGWLGLGG